MKNNQDYYLDQIDQIANNQNYNTFLVKDFANHGWLIFRPNTYDDMIDKKTKKLHFHFDSNYGDIRINNGNMYNGVHFEYSNVKDENKLFAFIKNFLEV